MSEDGKLVVANLDDIKRVAEALSSKARLAILETCSTQKHNVSTLSKLLGIPQSTVTGHIMTLDDAGLLNTESNSGRKGRQKLCSSRYRTIEFSLRAGQSVAPSVIEVDMPIGLFTQVCVDAPCGLASPSELIGVKDMPGSFLSPERTMAGLVWFSHGYIEYKFPNNKPHGVSLEYLEVSFEACSEAVDFNLEWPSDISVWVNGVKLGTWTSPGDFGDKRGKLNPAWWAQTASQYGILTVWHIAGDGSYLNESYLGPTSLEQLNIDGADTISLRIGIDDEANNKGGVNIFGDTFGNYTQGIILRMKLKNSMS